MDELQFGFLGIPALDCLCGLGFLLLSLCYLKTNPCFPVFCNQRGLHQQYGRAKRRRRRGRTFKGWRTCQREAEEGRKLLAALKGPLGQHYTIHFRQLLCPDLLCEVCNTAAKKVRRLSPATPEDAAISLDSTVRRWSPPL
ncbi:putative spermatogenesis-associated protein 31D4 isoform X1 [Heterocephalus glaber]|uniref:Spermatogenesis-associated protein 31D4 isoform X1 n=1 Tax=Heterocephalus glaber TaxID=10181 RepID=A0AAX6QQ72_HETGA|nr:putative spermatogenesis-associated protein 31D4 isoform X1 [Heterocephalus glaber]